MYGVLLLKAFVMLSEENIPLNDNEKLLCF